jgi:hypothetical protein
VNSGAWKETHERSRVFQLKKQEIAASCKFMVVPQLTINSRPHQYKFVVGVLPNG